MSRPRVLCVDDEPRVLDGIRRVLRNSFDVSTASSGEGALELLEHTEPFEVVVSDMHMPGMNGAAVLAEFRNRAADTVRILLTGHAAIDTAAAAVNEGQIFRFLLKPVAPERLSEALFAAVSQHRLVTAERVLLEQTLVGSVWALTEVLALVNPEVFAPTLRQHERVRAVARQLKVPDAWSLEVASMLASVGYVVLPSDVAVKLQLGVALDASELKMAAQVPEVVSRVLERIPRLEKVQALLENLDGRAARTGPNETMSVGWHVLHAVRELTALEAREGDTPRALRALRSSAKHPVEILEALIAACPERPPEIRELSLVDLECGMVLVADVKAKNGALLIARGSAISEQVLQRLRNFHLRVGVAQPILCSAPG